jgi:hypothetical protein
METDQEIEFDDADGLLTWLRANRAEAVQEPAPRFSSGKSRLRKLFEWG